MISLVMLLVSGFVSIFLAANLLDHPGFELLCALLFVGPIIFRYAAVRTDWGKSHLSTIAMAVRVAAVASVFLAAILLGNTVLDRGPAEHVEARVLEKDSHTGRSSYTRLRVVMLWRDALRMVTLDVASDTYRLAKIGDTVTVDVHPGFFHLPRYRSVKVGAPQPAP